MRKPQVVTSNSKNSTVELLYYSSSGMQDASKLSVLFPMKPQPHPEGTAAATRHLT